MLRTLFKNAKILNLEIENGFLDGNVVVQDGLIVYVGNEIPKDSYDQEIDVQGNILMPGLINTHAHNPMTIFRGLKDDVNLQEWLFEYIIPSELKMTDEDVYWGEMLGIAESVRNGITCFEENYFNYYGMCKAINNAKIRARVSIGPRAVTPENFDCYADLVKNNKIVDDMTDKNLVTKSIFAHSIYCTDERKFYDILKFATEQNLPVGIHLSETLKEVGDCTVLNNGLTPPAYLESIGFFDKPCLCAHCVHMDKDDLQILADYDVNVSVNMSSNIKLASGIPPIFAMQNKGLNISIGTDGVSSNNSIDMFKEMFLVATLSKVHISDPTVVSAKEVLQMATINGANAMQVNSGEIKVGKNADIILVDINQPHMQPCENLISNLVYSAKGSDVYFTMVNGKILYNQGKYFIGEELSEIFKNVNKIRQKYSVK